MIVVRVAFFSSRQLLNSLSSGRAAPNVCWWGPTSKHLLHTWWKKQNYKSNPVSIDSLGGKYAFRDMWIFSTINCTTCKSRYWPRDPFPIRKQPKGWWMVLWKLWVSQNFSYILRGSQSRFPQRLCACLSVSGDICMKLSCSFNILQGYGLEVLTCFVCFVNDLHLSLDNEF